MVRVLVVTTFESSENLMAALRAGASGFLAKSTRPADLLDGIGTLALGEALLSPAATTFLIGRFLSRPESLVRGTSLNGPTGREREVLTLNATGLTDQEIAGHLTVSPPLGQRDDLGSLRDRGGLGLHRARRSRSTRS